MRAALLFLATASLACDRGQAPTTPPTEAASPGDTGLDPDLARRMDLLAERIEAARTDLKIPGLALVVIKDGNVVLSRGFGVRDRGTGAPVDEDTLFAIGSTTKAFTATLVLMAVEEGKISLDDHPSTCVPYFKLQDETTNEKITVKDLLIHSSGLPRTDLAWYTGQLSTEEVIRVAGLAKPTADLGEAFQYQNVMYAAAGECVANVLGKPYPELLRERIFEPLGMTHGTNVSVAENLKLEARAVGYTKAGPEQQLHPVPMRPIDQVAAAGAINTSIRDIAPWLVANLSGGKYGEVELLSAKSFRELGKKHQKITPTIHYGLGWMRDTWRQYRRLHHGGGIDGFVTLISLLPKEGVGFALFTNIQNGDIQGLVTEEVFGALLDEKWGQDAGAGRGLPPGASEEVGKYGVIGGTTGTVELKDGKLIFTVPMQPPYELIHMEGRRYRLGPPAPAGFYATFRPREGEAGRDEIFLEQPQGDMVMPELRDEDYTAVKEAGIPEDLAELMGVYAVKGQEAELEVGASEGRVALLVPGQPAYPLVPREDGTFGMDGLPDTFVITAVREGKKLTGLTVKQPQVTLELTLRSKSAPPKISVDRLLKKMRRAAGSKKLAKLKNMRLTSTLEYVNQGTKARRTLYRTAEGHFREEVVLTALGRDIGTLVAGYDGKQAFEHTSFTEDLPLGTEQANMIVLAGLWDPLDPEQTLLVDPRIQRSGQVGDDPVVVLEWQVKTGGTVVQHVSTKSWRIVKVQSFLPAGPNGGQQSNTTTLEDYRSVGGVMIPHRTVTKAALGEVVESVQSVELDVAPPQREGLP